MSTASSAQVHVKSLLEHLQRSHELLESDSTEDDADGNETEVDDEDDDSDDDDSDDDDDDAQTTIRSGASASQQLSSRKHNNDTRRSSIKGTARERDSSSSSAHNHSQNSNNSANNGNNTVCVLNKTSVTFGTNQYFPISPNQNGVTPSSIGGNNETGSKRSTGMYISDFSLSFSYILQNYAIVVRFFLMLTDSLKLQLYLIDLVFMLHWLSLHL